MTPEDPKQSDTQDPERDPELNRVLQDWTVPAIPDSLENYMRYFLLPRRTSADARWIVCFACDRSAYPDAQPVWEDPEDGLAILRRPR